MIVVTEFYKNNDEKQHLNTDSNGFENALPNGRIKRLALSGNRTNAALSSTDFLQYHHCNGNNSHHKPMQAVAQPKQGQS